MEKENVRRSVSEKGILVQPHLAYGQVPNISKTQRRRYLTDPGPESVLNQDYGPSPEFMATPLVKLLDPPVKPYLRSQSHLESDVVRLHACTHIFVVTCFLCDTQQPASPWPSLGLSPTATPKAERVPISLVHTSTITQVQGAPVLSMSQTSFPVRTLWFIVHFSVPVILIKVFEIFQVHHTASYHQPSTIPTHYLSNPTGPTVHQPQLHHSNTGTGSNVPSIESSSNPPSQHQRAPLQIIAPHGMSQATKSASYSQPLTTKANASDVIYEFLWKGNYRQKFKELLKCEESTHCTILESRLATSITVKSNQRSCMLLASRL